MSSAAKSPRVAVTSIRAKEDPQFHVAVIALKSMCVISTELRHIGYSLADTREMFTIPEQIPGSQPIAL